MKYLVTNFIYGTGPFLRTTEIAIAINKELINRGKASFGIIVPWVMGDKQRRIMLEEFPDQADNIFLDARLGAILNTIFYNEKGYEDALRAWVENFEVKSVEAQAYLAGILNVETLSGKKLDIDGKDIEIEVNRSPRLSFGIKKSFGVTFGFASEIMQHVLSTPEDVIVLDRDLVRRAIPFAEKLESNRCTYVSQSGTFTYISDRKAFPGEVAVPPTINVPGANQEQLERGVYVTVTGIPGLDNLYKAVSDLGLKLYSNDPDKVQGSTKLSPQAIRNPNIVAQFARSGWGSVYLSQLVGTPLIVPAYDKKDDPEIYFNNKCIEELGLGIVYTNQSPEELIRGAEALRPRVQALNESLLKRFGTLNGAEYTAKLIVDDL